LLENAGRARKPDGGLDTRIIEPVRVAEGVTLEACEIGPNVTIESGSVLRRSKVRDAIIGENATIEDSELHDSLIGNSTVLRRVNGVVSLGDHATVEGG
jgi:glucose-1-phosphate thymidylyltransferase